MVRGYFKVEHTQLLAFVLVYLFFGFVVCHLSSVLSMGLRVLSVRKHFTPNKKEEVEVGEGEVGEEQVEEECPCG